MLYGRQEELSFLNNSYQSIGGQLLVLYGRRRTGKTATLLQFAKGKPCAYFSCSESTSRSQLAALATLLQQKKDASNHQALLLRRPKEFTDWGEALTQIPEIPGKGKKILILDEFTNLLKSSPDFLHVLRDIWETRLQYDNLMIILCTSSVQLAEEELLYPYSPLGECATGTLKMDALDHYGSAAFFSSWAPGERLTALSLLGGIPYYLSSFDSDKPLEYNIKTRLLGKDSPLFREPDHLLHSQLREISIYNAILEALALGNCKLSQIYEKTGIGKSKLTVYLKNLSDLGLVGRELPIHDGLREPVYVPHGIYRLKDPFFRFWYANVFPHRSLLEQGEADLIYDKILQPKLAEYSSDAFLHACRDYLMRCNKSGKLPFAYTEIGGFWNKEEAFPIMATDAKNTSFLVGECFASERLLTLPYLNKTIAKFKAKKKGHQAYFYYIFSLSGFAEEVRQPALRQGIELISGAQVFSAF